jgi:hypothetical protein
MFDKFKFGRANTKGKKPFNGAKNKLKKTS